MARIKNSYLASGAFAEVVLSLAIRHEAIAGFLINTVRRLEKKD